MEELAQRKLEAEIAEIEARTFKARVDAAKTEADSRAAQKSWRDWSLEAVKVVGAVALGIGGFTAAITGYQISEVKKARLDLEADKTKTELADLVSRRASTDAAVSAAQEQLERMKKEVEGLQGSLETAKKSGNGGQQIDEAISRAASIVKAVSATNNQLRTVDQSTPRARQLSDYLVGIQTLGVPDGTREAWNGKLRDEGYQLHENTSSYVDRPKWFAQRPTVLYYSRSALPAAQSLAGVMKRITGDDYAVQLGSGLGVDPGQRDVTLFVHTMKK